MRAAWAVLLIACATSAAANGTRAVQCWKDERGIRVCSDRVPPSDARLERQIIDGRGLVKKIVPAERSAEQRAADERAQAEATSRQQYDRYLLQTYASTVEIERARDERLATLDGSLRLARKAATESDLALQDMRKRAASDDAAIAGPARQQVGEFEKAVLENAASVDSLSNERERLATRFASDIERFRELRAAGRPNATD